MSAHVCRCFRTGIGLEIPAPDCEAPSHLWDEVEDAGSLVD